MRNVCKILALTMALCGVVQAKMAGSMAPPQPPADNPHPAQTDAAKAQVAFGELVVRSLLMEKVTTVVQGEALAYQNVQGVKAELDVECAKKPACWQRDAARLAYVTDLQSLMGQVTEFRHMHVIPWAWEAYETRRAKGLKTGKPRPIGKKARLKKSDMDGLQLAPNEFVLHTYAKFSRLPDTWHHLDVVLTEEDGVLRFQRFYLVPMATGGGKLPPGAVCRVPAFFYSKLLANSKV